MKLTNKAAIKALGKVRVLELEEMISDYPEQEVDGRSDWDMIANEAGWLLDSYNITTRFILSMIRFYNLPRPRALYAGSKSTAE